MKILFRFFLVLSFILSLNTPGNAQKRPKTGEPAPDINITEWVQGKTELKGKTIFLTFFETWCGNCIRIVKQMNKLTKKYSSDEVVFLYLSSENLDRLKNFLKRVKVEQLVVHDKGDKTIDSYQVTGVPETFIINKESTLVWRGHPGKLKDKHFNDYLKTGKTPAGVFRGPV